MSAPTSWVEGAAGSGFDVDHLPYGVVAPPGRTPYVAARVGDQVVDLSALAASPGLAPGLAPDLAPDLVPMLSGASLDPLLAAGPARWAAVRAWLQDLLTDAAAEPRVRPHLAPVTGVPLRLGFTVADYADFYASEHHATRVGELFRPGQPPLLSNWRHLPVGYHGRAGTVVVSGTPVRRPRGQRPGPDGPTVGPSERLDLEAELGLVVGVPSPQGTAVPASGFADHVFGVVGLNDWSARDLQAWEAQPLGPFLGKSFATSVSGWVTPLAALDAAWVDLPGQDPVPPAYLAVEEPAGLDLAVEVEVAGQVLTRPSFASMYWSPRQMLAHLTVNGASLRTGDLLGSGTISGAARDERGCLLELSANGAEPFDLAGSARCWLEDGDEVVLRYAAPAVGGGRLTLGEVAGTVLPALPPG